MTDGTRLEINETGTAVRLFPGLITGGRIQHDCGLERSITWFMEGILPLAPFAKTPLTLLTRGITNDSKDISVDVLKNVLLPNMMRFGLDGMELKVKRRGAPPQGGGEVILKCPIVRELKPINFVESGLIRRVRGLHTITAVKRPIALLS